MRVVAMLFTVHTLSHAAAAAAAARGAQTVNQPERSVSHQGENTTRQDRHRGLELIPSTELCHPLLRSWNWNLPSPGPPLLPSIVLQLHGP